MAANAEEAGRAKGVYVQVVFLLDGLWDGENERGFFLGLLDLRDVTQKKPLEDIDGGIISADFGVPF